MHWRTENKKNLTSLGQVAKLANTREIYSAYYKAMLSEEANVLRIRLAETLEAYFNFEAISHLA